MTMLTQAARMIVLAFIALWLAACSGGSASGEPTADIIRQALHSDPDFMAWRFDVMSQAPNVPGDAEAVFAATRVEAKDCKTGSGEGYLCVVRFGWPLADGSVSWDRWREVRVANHNGAWVVKPGSPNEQMWVGYVQTKQKDSEHPDYPPVLADLPLGYGFADGKPRDVLSIALGEADTDAAVSIASAYPELKLKANIDALQLVDDQNIGVTTGYHSFDLVDGKSGDKSVTLRVTYTTAINGARVSGIEREERYSSQQPDVAAFLQALVKKYGSPTTKQDTGMWMDLQWMWIEGELTPMSPLPPDACSQNRNLGAYRFVDNRRDDGKACTALLRVKVTYGQRPDLAQSIRMELWDLRRALENGHATDKWLIEAFRKAHDAIKAAPPPPV